MEHILTTTPSRDHFDRLTDSKRLHCRKETAAKVARDAAERARVEYWNKFQPVDWLEGSTFSPMNAGKRVASKRRILASASSLSVFEDVGVGAKGRGTATPNKRQPFSSLLLRTNTPQHAGTPLQTPAMAPLTPHTQVYVSFGARLLSRLL